MAVLDKNLLLRDGSTTLTASGNGAWIDLGSSPLEGGHTIRIEYPITATGAGATCDMVIESSDDGSTAHGDKITLKQETASTTPATRLVIYNLPHRFCRWNATIAGTTPSFGNVLIGVDAGELKITR